MATHVMTPARRAALRKAQLASAAKRRGRFYARAQQARTRRNRAVSLQGSGLNFKAKSRAHRQFQSDINAARVGILGKAPRSQRNQNIRRYSRTAGRYGVIGASTTFQLAVAGNKTAGKTLKYGAIGGVSVAKSPHVAKGFAKGFKQGYSARRATTSVTRNNLRNAGVGSTHVSSQRVGPLALTAGSGRGHQGRRVRGY